MARYLVEGNYVGEGVKGLMAEGASSRREAVEQLIGSVGGTVESIYYAFGPTDIYVIADIPDNETAAALSLITNASGAVTVRVTVLLTVEEMDAATRKTPTYRKPGG